MNIDTTRERDGGRASPPASMVVMAEGEEGVGRGWAGSLRGLCGSKRGRQDNKVKLQMTFICS